MAEERLLKKRGEQIKIGDFAKAPSSKNTAALLVTDI